MENKYANTLLESIDNIKFGLKYYIERCLELENELAKKQVEYDKTHIYTPQTIKLNYIPVQKIKGKIEDLKMSGGSDGKDNTENTARELAIEALQDILEESEK